MNGAGNAKEPEEVSESAGSAISMHATIVGSFLKNVLSARHKRW